ASSPPSPQASMSGSYTPTPGGPFSALTPSMWPQDLLSKYYQKDSEELEIQYDEFGFRVESEADGTELQPDQLSGTPLVEDPQQRLRWQAHLEFTHNHAVGDLTWEHISPTLARSDRLRALVLAGIPHSMRPQLWMRLSGALQKKRTSEITYREIVKNSSNDDTTAAKQVRVSTVPPHSLFYSLWVLRSTVTISLSLQEDELVSSENSASIFNTLSDLPCQLTDGQQVLEEAVRLAGALSPDQLEAQRRKHLAYILAEQAELNTAHTLGTGLGKVVRRQSQRRKSALTSLLFGDDEAEALKAKNIRQTELVATLREAIGRLATHFHCLDPRHSSTDLTPDYSMESHQRDHENFVLVSRCRRRRARALLDFERHDDDELGFRKNDIITVVSCLLLFLEEEDVLWMMCSLIEDLLPPSYFTSTLLGVQTDQRVLRQLIVQYLPRLDRLLQEHDIELSLITLHWFLTSAASREVERDFNSVYSRLVLCKTYRLDEDGKVLTPEELLYRAVQSVNMTHDTAHAQMDVKFRSLICVGLNEQVLHLWLEVLCSSVQSVEKWYQPWSFLRSPGWVQIKCELRVLSKFAFSLSQDCELPDRKEQEKEQKPLKEGVQDMLVKHHLFSWDIDG
uniref:RUN and TBC1 domain-containing protein 3 n=1 Tax=Lepisosteus oculatus TaxID=7918 RepID=W5MZQ6_LEPOC